MAISKFKIIRRIMHHEDEINSLKDFQKQGLQLCSIQKGINNYEARIRRLRKRFL